MTFSPSIKRGMLRGITDEGLIALLTIDHPELGQPIRWSNDRVDTVSGAEIYRAAPFDFTIPDELEGQQRGAEITIVDLSRDLTRALLTLTEAPSVSLQLVRMDDPESVEMRIDGLVLQAPSWAPPQPVVTGRLVMLGVGDDRFPRARFFASNFPGVVR